MLGDLVAERARVDPQFDRVPYLREAVLHCLAARFGARAERRSRHRRIPRNRPTRSAAVSHRARRPQARRARLERRAPRAHRRPLRPHRRPRLGARRGDGFLLFSDLISNVIYRWAPGEPISVYLDRSGYSGNELAKAGFQTRRGRMAVLLIGPNGLSLDARRPPALSRRERPRRDAARARRHAYRRRRSLRRPPLQRPERSRRALERLDLSHGQRLGPARRPRESRFRARFQRRFPDPRRRDYTVVQRRRQPGRLAERHRAVARRALPVHEYGRPKRAALRARRRRHAAQTARCSSPAKAATA